MKRGRSSRVSKRPRNKNRKTNHIQIHYPGPSLLDLPKDILQNIFFRLPIKSIFVCKSVCKTCHDIISDPEFEKLHFDETRDRFYPLIHAEKFYLLQPDKDDFEPNKADFVFDTKLDLYSFIDDLLLQSFRRYSTGYRRDNPPGQKVGFLVCRRKCIIRFVNSCNGLLCKVIFCLIPRVNIWNPITGEYITIPQGNQYGNRIKIPECNKYGFGFSHVANKYKVVRISNENRSAQVHIVGTEESWRDIDSKPNYLIHCNPIYFKGFLYWPTSQKSLSLMLFDIEHESFGLDSGPMDKPYKYVSVNVGILRGELCISSVTESKTIHIWAKKDSGVEITQWSKVYSIDLIWDAN